MRDHGYTLIELMVTVAIVAITVAAAGVTGARTRQVAVAEFQREEARILLDYHAACSAAGRRPDPVVLARLEAPLPDVVVDRGERGDVVTLRVSWRDPLGRRPSMSRAVFERRGP